MNVVRFDFVETLQYPNAAKRDVQSQLIHLL